VDGSTRALVQGITGRQGAFHARLMRASGTRIVAGVAPGKRGARVPGLEDVPVFESVAQAREATGATASIAFLPPLAAAGGLIEAIEAGLELVVSVTDGIPAHDMMRVRHRMAALRARGWPGRLVGPNGPGVIAPGKAKLGIMPDGIFRPGPVAVLSRSGSLSYETAQALSRAGIGQSTVVGVGGDLVKGEAFEDLLPLAENDPETRMVVLLGEAGGPDERRAAGWIGRSGSKPVVALVVGRGVPEGVPLGHPGAWIQERGETAEAKAEALRSAGATLASDVDDLVKRVRAILT
jgi:succinyl-CoA synthetase alpha subunit